MKVKPLFTTYQWLVIVGSVVSTGAAVTAFAFVTFPQKSDLKDILLSIDHRLENLERALIREKSE